MVGNADGVSVVKHVNVNGALLSVLSFYHVISHTTTLRGKDTNILIEAEKYVKSEIYNTVILLRSTEPD